MTDPRDIPTRAPSGMAARLGALLRRVPGGKFLLPAVGVAALVAGASVWWSSGAEAPRSPREMLAEAMQALEQDDLDRAQRIAIDQRMRRLENADRSVSAFVLGVVLARKAERELAPGDRKQTYLLASQYLLESRTLGWPPQQQANGTRWLASSMFLSGEYAASQPMLLDALASAPNDAALRRMLAESYVRSDPARLDRALAAANEWLAVESDRDLRDQALLLKAGILLRQEKLAAASLVLAEMPEESTARAAAHLLRGRLRMAEALTDESVDVRALGSDVRLQQAIDAFHDVILDVKAPASVTSEAQYWVGKCLLLQNKLPEAEEHYRRVQKVLAEHDAALAAGMDAADSMLRRGDAAGAHEAYRQLFPLVGDTQLYDNRLLPLGELQQRLRSAFETLLSRQEFEVAAEFAAHLDAVLSPAESVDMQARAAVAATDALEAQAETLPPAAARDAEAISRKKARAAARLYERLARLHLSDRRYLDDLGASAANYQRGHDFEQAAKLWQAFLDNDPGPRHAEALVGLAEAQLALNRTDETLRAVQYCLERYASHPLSYRARIVASRAYRERGELEAAQALLEENLHHDLLTPRSREWRDSLFDLGELHYRQGSELHAAARTALERPLSPEGRREAFKQLEAGEAAFRKAIAALEEAVAPERYPDAPQATLALYLLAESYRQAARWPMTQYDEAEIETTRSQLQRQAQDYLAGAATHYDALARRLAPGLERGELTELETEILRNCYFSRADALFDQGNYAEAIVAYTSASNRYHNQPESLEALAQIAACQRRQGQPDKARGTLHQARLVWKSIPPELDFTRTTRYNRDDWIAYLDWLGAL